MTEPVNGEGWDDAPGGVSEDGFAGRPGSGEHGEWLTEVLDSEYGRYEPDSQRIRTMLDERMEGGRRAGRSGARVLSPASRLRLAGIPAGIAAAALCATLAVAVTATVTDNQPNSAPNAAGSRGGLPAASDVPGGQDGGTPAGSPGGGTRGTVTGQGAGVATESAVASGSPSGPGSASASSSAGASLVTAVGSLATASNQTWTEEDVNITLAQPVTQFRLIVRLTPSAGLTPDNYWSNHDITAFNVVLNSDTNGLVYTFTLKSGKSLPAGPFIIAVQFAHSRQRDASGDTFSLSATSDQAHGGASSSAQGSF